MKKKMSYVPPLVTVTRVVLEEGIVKVPVSCNVSIEHDWIEVETPVGEDPSADGGDIKFFF